MIYIRLILAVMLVMILAEFMPRVVNAVLFLVLVGVLLSHPAQINQILSFGAGAVPAKKGA